MNLLKNIFTVKYTIVGLLIVIIYNALIPYFVEQNIPKADQFLGGIIVFSLLLMGVAKDITDGLNN